MRPTLLWLHSMKVYGGIYTGLALLHWPQSAQLISLRRGAVSPSITRRLAPLPAPRPTETCLPPCRALTHRACSLTTACATLSCSVGGAGCTRRQQDESDQLGAHDDTDTER